MSKKNTSSAKNQLSMNYSAASRRGINLMQGRKTTNNEPIDFDRNDVMVSFTKSKDQISGFGTIVLTFR